MDFRILIVDDDKNLLSVLESLFSEEGYQVVTCSNGAEAIKQSQGQNFDLVITDIMMPGATGLDVLQEVKKIDSDILVVLITGFASLESAVRAIREGAYDYITKPFKLEEIKIVARNALEKIQLIRENRRLMEDLQKAYEKLHVVKKIMEDEPFDRPYESIQGPASAERKTVIAGNLYPHHFQANPVRDDFFIASQLERIARLRERKIITEKEFEICKSHLFRNLA